MSLSESVHESFFFSSILFSKLTHISSSDLILITFYIIFWKQLLIMKVLRS